MRTIILASLLLASTVAQAQVQMSKKVMCSETAVVFEELQSEKYREVIRWSGTDLTATDHMYVLLVNEDKGTFTFIETWGNTACVLGAGTKPEFYTQPKGKPA